jgi:sigma-B regulation protein RsbU (phosphoserine phosphatase)
MFFDFEINDEFEDDIEYLRKKHVNTGKMVLIGYSLTQIGTLVAKISGLTSISYTDIAILASTSIGITLIFIIIMALYKKSTKKFGDLMFFTQLFIFIPLYSVWIYKLHEIRSFGLISALIAVTFVVFYTDSVKSLLISIGTVISQVCISYYAIEIVHQKGSFLLEAFFALSFLPSFLFISQIAREMQKRTDKLQAVKKETDYLNKTLMEMNVDLGSAYRADLTDMDLASTLQSLILPKEPLKDCGWDIAFSYKPYHKVSGDFYDFYSSNEKLYGISLFDVAGHGLASGLITMIAKPVIWRLYNTMKTDDLGKIFGTANREITEQIYNTDVLITGIMLRVYDDSVEYVNAGHPNLYCKNSMNKDIVSVCHDFDGFKGRPIGFSFDAEYKSHKFSVTKGDTLLLFTDCILEARDGNRISYGDERLISSFNDAPDASAQEILDFILNRFYSSVNKKDINDDFTVIIAKKS